MDLNETGRNRRTQGSMISYRRIKKTKRTNMYGIEINKIITVLLIHHSNVYENKVSEISTQCMH